MLEGQDQVHVFLDMVILAQGHVRSNELRALAVTSKRRSPLFPNLPPIANFVRRL